MLIVREGIYRRRYVDGQLSQFMLRTISAGDHDVEIVCQNSARIAPRLTGRELEIGLTQLQHVAAEVQRCAPERYPGPGRRSGEHQTYPRSVKPARKFL